MGTVEDPNPVRLPVSLSLAAYRHHLRPVKIPISHSEEIQQFVIRVGAAAGISGPMRDDPSHLTLRTTQCHSPGDPRTA